MSISQIFPFQSLPRELRDEVYKFSLPQDDPSKESTWLRFKCQNDPSASQLLENSKSPLGNDDTRAIKNGIQGSSSRVFPLPPICLASKTTYNEAVPLVLQCSTIYCSSPDTIQYLFDWLAKFPHPDGYGSIRSLVIEYGMIDARECEAIARSCQRDLFGKCTNLRYLTLLFRRPFVNLVVSGLNRINPFRSEAPNIVGSCQFEEIVAIPMLEKLVLDFSSAYEATHYMVPEHMNDWYARRWKEEERAVVLECKPADLTHYREEEGRATGWIMVD
jgi:hypothetical protein